MILNLNFMMAAALAAAASAPASADAVERARYLMGTVCRIAASHPEPGRAAVLVEKAFSEISRWESILSDYDRASELSRLNAEAGRAPFACSDDLFAFLSRSRAFSEETRGAFDITVGALVDLYEIRRGGRWPSPAEIESTRLLTGYRRLRLDAGLRTARFEKSGMRLDPGGIGKGVALDAAGRLLREGGVRWALLDFGGQVLAVGTGPDGCGFPVEVAAAGRASGSRSLIRLRDASASTSGNDERGLIVGGRLLGHILDPRSGIPARGVTGVTAVAADATRADALSTALFVMGPEAGLAAAPALGVEALYSLGEGDAVRVLATPGFRRLEDEGRMCAGDAPAPPAISP